MSRMYRNRKAFIIFMPCTYIYIRSYDVEDIMDGFHFEIFIVNKLDFKFVSAIF